MTYGSDFKISILENFFSKKLTRKEILEVYKISRKTLYNWIQKYKYLFKKQYNKKFIQKKISESDNKRKVRKNLLNDELKEYISKYVVNNYKFKCKNLLRNLRTKFKIKISKSTLYNWFSKMNITYKRSRKKIIVNMKKTKKQISELSQKIKNSNVDDIISVDEFSSETDSKPSYGWNLIGKQVNFRLYNNNRKKVSVIAAISNKKIIGYKVIEGSVNSEIFTNFIKELNVSEESKVLLMDNARIHHSKIFKSYIDSTKNKVIYNVPYSPEFNPIELSNSKVKQIINKETNDTMESLRRAIDKAYSKISKSDCEHYFSHAFTLLFEKV